MTKVIKLSGRFSMTKNSLGTCMVESIGDLKKCNGNLNQGIYENEPFCTILYKQNGP